MSSTRLHALLLYTFPLLVMALVTVVVKAFSYTPLRALVTLVITASSLYYITRIYIYFKLGVIEESFVKLFPKLRIVKLRNVLVSLLFVVALGGLLEHAMIGFFNSVYLSLVISAATLIVVVSVVRRFRWKLKTTCIGTITLSLFLTLHLLGLVNDHGVEYFENLCKLLEEILYGS